MSYFTDMGLADNQLIISGLFFLAIFVATVWGIMRRKKVQGRYENNER
jgi:hypothetical protein